MGCIPTLRPLLSIQLSGLRSFFSSLRSLKGNRSSPDQTNVARSETNNRTLFHGLTSECEDNELANIHCNDRIALVAPKVVAQDNERAQFVGPRNIQRRDSFSISYDSALGVPERL